MRAIESIFVFMVVIVLHAYIRIPSVENVIQLTENSQRSGKLLFNRYCIRCHGAEGNKGKFGAKNLQKSTLDDEQYNSIIRNGKGIMPAWEKRLTSMQISSIIKYIKSLRK